MTIHKQPIYWEECYVADNQKLSKDPSKWWKQPP
jgi:hypothetical protein